MRLCERVRAYVCVRVWVIRPASTLNERRAVNTSGRGMRHSVTDVCSGRLNGRQIGSRKRHQIRAAPRARASDTESDLRIRAAPRGTRRECAPALTPSCPHNERLLALSYCYVSAPPNICSSLAKRDFQCVLAGARGFNFKGLHTEMVLPYF